MRRQKEPIVSMLVQFTFTSIIELHIKKVAILQHTYDMGVCVDNGLHPQIGDKIGLRHHTLINYIQMYKCTYLQYKIIKYSLIKVQSVLRHRLYSNVWFIYKLRLSHIMFRLPLGTGTVLVLIYCILLLNTCRVLLQEMSTVLWTVVTDLDSVGVCIGFIGILSYYYS